MPLTRRRSTVRPGPLDAIAAVLVAIGVTSAAVVLVASVGMAQVATTPDSASAPPGPAIDVVSYDAAITPDLATRSVTGQVRIRLTATRAASDVTFDRGLLTVDQVSHGGVAQPFDLTDRRVVVHLGTPLGAGQTRDLDVAYHGTPGFGLQFPPERSQVYTVFTTSDWMVSADVPGDRATLRLRVTLPEALAAVGVGAAVGTTPAGQGLRVHEWRLDAPAPPYTFGFAAGPFTTVSAGRDRFLGAGFSAAELRRIFADTDAMLRFFERRAGVPYPHATYTQALVARTVGQEMSGLSLLSEDYGRAVLADPTAITLGAHEAAHQWWGNLLTCEAWTQFWLNEGMATFMAAAFLEVRFGRPAYDRAVERFRTEYSRVRDAGGDKPLVFPAWNRPSADDRTLVYQKGALVLHELRGQLGDPAFWKGLRAYTREFVGHSVTTVDFQHAMERSSGQDLTPFFARWVYAAR
ncbi:MAG: M1 family metallopeptidase [Acidobacteriota bacterium]